MKSLNEELFEVKEKQRLKTKWQDHSDRLLESMQKKKAIARELKLELYEKEEDVENLRTFTVGAVMATILGNKQEKMTEREEVLAKSKLRYQDALQAVEELEKEKQMYDEHLETVRYADAEYRDILKRKEELILNTDSVWSEQLFRATEKEVELHGAMQEVNEAIEAGEDAYYSLRDASASLEKASNWSKVDMFGGGMVTTYIKHSHIDDSKNATHRAERRLRQFNEELQDVKNHFNIHVTIGEGLTFADYFFDNIFVDFAVHQKISSSSESISSTMSDVSRIVNELKSTRQSLQRELDEISKERIQILENS
ncbi:hypothetical protein FLK61_31305 [Paenalkalicoccus suaedae]|uniref:Uncharacterized protein n=1 Tax=Paenalkalicoccus suaedae TaxID=2592382 RepID=A0A859FCX7_9BACI|nr:hypothetical protein [Paenalkalicoccus suaedae]QKS71203.1 hypothetical protein FLK61_31305 [Paenalkalicoccus suaedae]